jgi:hypothetical protein
VLRIHFQEGDLSRVRVARAPDPLWETGVNHLILAITDAALVKAFSGMDLPGVATMREQLRVVHEQVMPALGRPQ